MEKISENGKDGVEAAEATGILAQTFSFLILVGVVLNQVRTRGSNWMSLSDPMSLRLCIYN